MKRNQIILAGVGLLIVALLIYTFTSDEPVQRDLKAQAFRADFEELVVSTGELLALNSEEIRGPDGMRRYGLYNIKIADLVPEGSYVKKGDIVAKLDKTELSSRMSSVYTELEKARSQYTQTKLDTALQLRKERSNLESLAFDLRQKKIELKQSKYEPPATIQRIKLELEKLKQSLRQAEENYQIIKRQSAARMQEAAANLTQERRKYEALQELEKEFTIRAPKPGMVIYYREWDGEKREAGSNISPWNPTVATLPDLSVMQSKTYINEVDIRKVKKGQPVRLGLDALPDAKLTGSVTSVANVGEKREGYDSKVFEVIIRVDQSDSTYRPGMTTSNEIVVNQLEDKLQIPLEAVFTQNDTTFVYTTGAIGTYKQEVRLGASNDRYAVVKGGLEAGATVYLNQPAGTDEMKLETLSAAAKE